MRLIAGRSVRVLACCAAVAGLTCAARGGLGQWIVAGGPFAERVSGPAPPVAHLPDGRLLAADDSRLLLQRRWDLARYQDFTAMPSNAPVAFLAVFDEETAVLGYGAEHAAPAYRFHPSRPDAPGFTPLGVYPAACSAVFRPDGALYLAGPTGTTAEAAVRLVTLDGATNRVVVAGLSSGGAALDLGPDGALHVMAGADGSVRRFSAAAIEAALTAGEPAAFLSGALLHAFDIEPAAGGLAVDGLGRLWARGAGGALRLYDPATGADTARTPLPGAELCAVGAFRRQGRDYVSFAAASAGPPAAGYYGYDLTVFHAMADSRYPFAGPQTVSNAYDQGIAGRAGGLPSRRFAAWATRMVDYTPADQAINPMYANPSNALGAAEADNTHVVSLGDLSAEQILAGAQPGSLTLGFDVAIADGPGADFAVFENAFVIDGDPGLMYAELAYVEVSTDGTNFCRFPSVGLHSPDTIYTNALGRGYTYIDARQVFNLAGKHVNVTASWGTPFDLADLAHEATVENGVVDIDDIRFVRLVDIPGSGGWTDASSPARPLYDAWVTWGSGGVDIDAVGVINFRTEITAARMPSGIELAWQAVTNRRYRVQAADALHGTNWQDLGEWIHGDGLTHSVADTNAPCGIRFYRVRKTELPEE